MFLIAALDMCNKLWILRCRFHQHENLSRVQILWQLEPLSSKVCNWPPRRVRIKIRPSVVIETAAPNIPLCLSPSELDLTRVHL